jgi:phosphoserine phosphatase
MLGAAGLGVAFHAHPGVQGIAPTNIRYADLTALLYMQGYRRDEILRG